MNGKSADLLFHIDCLECTLGISLCRRLIEFNTEYCTEIVDSSFDIIGPDGDMSVLAEIGLVLNVGLMTVEGRQVSSLSFYLDES